MDKKAKNRDVRTIFLSLFPNIDRDALDDILNQPSIFDISITTNTDRRQLQSSGSLLSLDDSAFINDYDQNDTIQTPFGQKTIMKFDQQFEHKEDKYLRAVRKAVTTQNLPNLPNMGIGLSKNFTLPSFLKKTFKTIASRLGKASNEFNKLLATSFSKLDTVYALNVAGSSDTDYAFDLVTKRVANLNETNKFIFGYISPTLEEDKSNNYRNKKDIVLGNYLNNMRSLDIDRFFFFNEEKNTKKYSHPIQQIEALCQNYSVQYMLTGFSSLKGPKGDNKFLEKALGIMLKNQRTPFIIMKENVYQKPESSLEGFNWLFVFDKINVSCFNIVKKFSPLIDLNKDRVHGYTLLPNSQINDEIQPLFMKEFGNKSNLNVEYEMQRYDSDAYVYANKKVNFGNTHYDFIVLYNNICYSDFTKANVEKQMISNMHIILGASSNICVMNGS